MTLYSVNNKRCVYDIIHNVREIEATEDETLIVRTFCNILTVAKGTVLRTEEPKGNFKRGSEFL